MQLVQAKTKEWGSLNAQWEGLRTGMVPMDLQFYRCAVMNGLHLMIYSMIHSCQNRCKNYLRKKFVFSEFSSLEIITLRLV